MATNAYIALQADVAGAPANTFKQWNYIQSQTGGSNITLEDDSNVSTGWTMTVVTGYEPEGKLSTGVNTGCSGDAAWVDETIISEDYWYMTTADQVARLSFTGLDNAKKYKIEVYASRSTAGNRLGEYAVTSDFTGSVTLEASNNSTNTASISGISPSSNEIILYWRHYAGEDVAYLNAIWFQEEDASASTALPLLNAYYS
jgi:hypothetical protein